MIMAVSITNATSVNNHAIFQERLAIIFTHLAESRKKVCETIDMESIDLGNILLFMFALIS